MSPRFSRFDHRKQEFGLRLKISLIVLLCLSVLHRFITLLFISKPHKPGKASFSSTSDCPTIRHVSKPSFSSVLFLPPVQDPSSSAFHLQNSSASDQHSYVFQINSWKSSSVLFLPPSRHIGRIKYHYCYTNVFDSAQKSATAPY